MNSLNPLISKSKRDRDIMTLSETIGKHYFVCGIQVD